MHADGKNVFSNGRNGGNLELLVVAANCRTAFARRATAISLMSPFACGRRFCSGCSRSPWNTDVTVYIRKPTFDLQRRRRASDRCQYAADVTKHVCIARTWDDRWSWLLDSEDAAIRTPRSRSTSTLYVLSPSTCEHDQTPHVPRRSCSLPQAWPSTKRSIPS